MNYSEHTILNVIRLTAQVHNSTTRIQFTFFMRFM